MSDAVQRGRVLDVTGLPTVVFSHRSLMWWGTLGVMAIEGTVFGLAIMAYFYLRSHQATWPITAPPPDLLWGSLNLLVMLVSFLPAHLAKRAAERCQLGPVRIWLVVSVAFGLLFCGLRVMEFATLNVRWDSNAYGSASWFLLGLHTAHILTDLGDTLVLTVLMFTRHGKNGRRFSDVSDNAMYWDFVVLAWLPIYALLYWVPRLA